MAIEVGLRALGAHVPERVVANADLEPFLDVDDAWIRDRTGIAERRVAPQGVTNGEMACSAARRALAAAGLDGRELAFVISSTCSADLTCPTVAARVGSAVDLGEAFCFDLNAVCSGLVYALAMGESLLRTRGGGHGLVTASEQMTGLVARGDRDGSILFGDGAAAVVLTSEGPRHRIVHAELGADPGGADLITMGGQEAFGTGDRRYFHQDGRKVFRFGASILERLVRRGLEVAGLSAGDRFHVVPHQANLRVIQHAARAMGVPEDRFVTNVQTRGNTGSASIGIALHDADAAGRFAPGEVVLLAGFGGGLTWGLVVLEWWRPARAGSAAPGSGS